jgi:1-acyl-sn-glycerol-3-phosphate acyltransferase
VRAAQILFFTLFVRPFITLFMGLRTSNVEAIPQRGPFILIANHSSHLDTITLLSLFPLTRLHAIRPVAAADYFTRNAFVSFVSRLCFNILPIARKDFTAENHPIDVMDAALKRGDSLIVFPEGTRGSGETMAAFRSGVARVLERNQGTLVVPAYLVNMGRSLPKGEWFPLPFFCEVRIGTPFAPDGDKDAMTAQMEQAVRTLT